MWQPPARLSPLPAHLGDQQPLPEQTSLSVTQSSLGSSNLRCQIAGSREKLQIAAVTRVSRIVDPRKRGPRRGSDRLRSLNQGSNTSRLLNTLPQYGSSWTFKYKRSINNHARRHIRLENLYDMQYTSRSILNSVHSQIVQNGDAEYDSPRLSIKRTHQEPHVTHSSNEDLPENLPLWSLKDRPSSMNSDYVITSCSSSQSLVPEGSPVLNSSSEYLMPNTLFNTQISNSPSMANYSTVNANNTITCSNPSTSFASFTTSETFGRNEVSSTVESTGSSSTEMSRSEILSVKSHPDISSAKPSYPDAICAKKTDGDKNSEVVLVELHKLHGSLILNLPPPTIQARKVANSVIKYSRHYKTPDERAICCLNCDRIPTFPVTGQCGHTRCSKCVKENATCPCGTKALSDESSCVNTVVQEIISKMCSNQESPNRIAKTKRVVLPSEPLRRHHASSFPNVTVAARRVSPYARLRRLANSYISTQKSLSAAGAVEGRMPLSPQARFKRAQELLASGQYREAAPHLARVAAAAVPFARRARSLLAQAISALSEMQDPRRLTRELYMAVRLQSAGSWLRPADLECVLCYHTYTRPVTTPCGHTYCRTCIERSLDYRKTCALCLRPLDDFNLATTCDTEFVSAALASIDAVSSPSPPDPDVIPIFVCTVAFPSIPCPLFIFDPRYWMMIRRILESGSRKFGMVAYERDRSYSDYGTVLEVCDCVHLEDGRSILSTVGVSRFRVIERDVRDGCDVARIQPLIDIVPTDESVWELRVMASQISYKALVWMEGMSKTVRSEIEAAFGEMPHFDQEEDWWESPDGPEWLWWLIAILPLRSEIKILILSTRSLLKRMMAVCRTLEAMDAVAFNSNSSSECELGTALNNTDDWLERSA